MFKKLIFMALAGYSASAFAMDKSYTPSFSARHPIISRTLKSVSAGIATSMAAEVGAGYFDTNHEFRHSLLAGAAVATGVWVWDSFKKPHLLDAILCDPYQAHYHVNAMHQSFSEELKKLEATCHNNDALTKVTQIKNLITKYRSQTPLSLIGECDIRMPFRKGLLWYESSFGCALDRSKNPHFRGAFENAAVKAMLEQSAQLARPLIYASHGCGAKFQDIVNITKFLAQKPNAKIDIHLIDPRHNPYTNYFDLNNQTREIIAGQELKLNSLLAAIEMMKKSDKDATAQLNAQRPMYLPQINYDEKKSEFYFAAQITSHDAMHKEFLEWLQTNFPKATIKLFTHESALDYCQAIENGKYQYPDVITAADIQDDTCRNAIPDYALLCVKTLQNKPQSKNIFLCKKLKNILNKGFTEGAVLLTFSLNPVTAADPKIEFVAPDNSRHTLFPQEQDL